MKQYPNVTRLFESKERERRRLARLPFDEKITIVEQWQKMNPVFDAIRQKVRGEYAIKLEPARKENLLKRD